MKYLLALAILTIASLGSAQILQVGQRLKIPGAGEVWVSDTKAFSLKDLGPSVEVLGLKEGSGKIRLGSQIHEINVLSSAQYQCYERINFYTKQTLDLATQVQNGKILVKGSLSRFREWERLEQMLKDSSCQYGLALTPNREMRSQLEKEFSEQALKEGWSSLKVRFERGILEAPETTPSKDSLTEWAKGWGLKTEFSKTAIQMLPMVRFQIIILELKKSAQEALGLRWGSNYSAQLIPEHVQMGSIGFNADLVEKSGWGKVLASPTLLCRGGKTAEFLAGGEIPLILKDRKTQSVMFKKFGILLKVAPEVDLSGRMSLFLETEISSPDGSTAIEGVPGFQTNRVQSYFDLANPRTVVLSGLMRYQESLSQPALSGLASVPFLGALFRSNDYLKNQSELVIAVRPQVIAPNGDEL